MKHEVAVNQISLTYSWHNITSDYNNNSLKYSPDNVTTWKTVTFPNGMYSYDDLNDYLPQIMKKNNHFTNVNGEDEYDINLDFVLSTYKVIIELTNNYHVDLRENKLGELIGFDHKILKSTEEGRHLPNITNSVKNIK